MQARYYDPVIGRFYGNDPIGFTASNMMSFNRYMYVNNNPYKYVDPDGKKLRFAAGSTSTFKNQFAQIIKYHNKHGTSAIFARLEAHADTVTISEGINHQFSYNPATDTIQFDPTSALVVGTGKVQTPALGVLHEAAHAESDLTNPKQHNIDRSTPTNNFPNVEERDATSVETAAAIKIGEPTRSVYAPTGSGVKRVSCPTCTK